MGYYIAIGATLLGIILVSVGWILYYRTTDLYRFNKAKGHQLVSYIEWIFCRKGYELVEVKYVSDLEAEALISKNSVVTMVQIRRRKSKYTKTMVEFVYNTALKDDCDWAIIISPAGFTKEACASARDLGITLYDRSWLRNVLKGCRLKYTG